ncbi:ABC transporter ATP-binding protein [Xanthobacter sp. V4C-4]|uniref:dipeptide ABC transporter ATP-binding protein n=1 Tax=Xanthobacter cornucopiae TaxID=3119924 RepID=UPI003729608C
MRTADPAADRTAHIPRPAAPPAVPLVEVRALRVGFGRADRPPAVKSVSFDLHAGRCLAIVGESGSGKSVTARALIGLAGRGARVEAERLRIQGRDVIGQSERAWRALRGRTIGYVLQDALVSLDPLKTVGSEVTEGLFVHGAVRRGERAARAAELLRRVGVPDPELKARQLPHELSGGQRQRALIAAALALDPDILVADEPTTALDATIQAQVLALLDDIRARGKTLVLISHDLAVVARMADEVLIMRHGEVVEHGPAAKVFAAPAHPYTRALIDAVPSAHSRGARLAPAAAPRFHAASSTLARPDRSAAAVVARAPLLAADGLVKSFRRPDGSSAAVVHDVSFSIARGEALGIVGESGSGKSTVARLVLALETPDAGAVRLDGQPWSALAEAERRPRRRDVSVVYQDPLSHFDPRWTVERIIADALPRGEDRSARAARVGELLDLVGLPDGFRARRPLDLSGGQRQRAAIARAIAPGARLIVCDEPVSALDVSIQAQVLDLLADLKAELGVSYLFISHDLGVVHHLCDRVLVLKAGRVVEQGPSDDVFLRPVHPYTRELVAAVPRLGAGRAA